MSASAFSLAKHAASAFSKDKPRVRWFALIQRFISYFNSRQSPNGLTSLLRLAMLMRFTTGACSPHCQTAIHHSSSLQSIPELIDSIGLQASGSVLSHPLHVSYFNYSRSPAEASRAIRKKIKHGSSHQQYRALVVRLQDLFLHHYRNWFTDPICPRRELWPEIPECAFTIYFLPFIASQTSIKAPLPTAN